MVPNPDPMDEIRSLRHEAANLRTERARLRPRGSDGEIVWAAFHRAWMWSVGKPGYDKAVWLAVEAALINSGEVATIAKPRQADA